MTTPTLVGHTQATPWTHLDDDGPHTSTGTPLPDGTILLAWGQPSGTITLARYDHVMTTVLGQTTLTDEGNYRGLVLLVDATGTVVLLTGEQSWTITLDPLTATLGPGHNTAWWNATRAQALVGDATVITGDYILAVHRPGQPLTVHDTPHQPTTIHPGPTPGTAYITSQSWPARAAQVHVVDLATGAWAGPVATGPVTDADFEWLASTGPDGWTFTWMDKPDIIQADSAGAIISAPNWPANRTAAAFPHGPGATAPAPDSATLAALYVNATAAPATLDQSALGLLTITADGITVTDLPLPQVPRLQSLSVSPGPTLTVHGRTAVVTQVVYQYLAGDLSSPRTLAVLAYAIDLGGADSRLKVQTLGGWRRVGLESWEEGPGRLKLRVPTSVAPSGWVMEVKPGDDTSEARAMSLRLVDPATGVRHEQVVRFIPWVRPDT